MSPTPQDSSSHKPSHLKRGGSSDLDQDPPKRARKDSASQEEKKRGRRLFGGLLGTLGQNDAGSQQRKRHGIEKRSQDRIAKQIEEEDRRREDGLARITEVRRAEQVVFLEKVVRTKYVKNMQLARFLRTTAKPHIYYLPRNLSAEEDAMIEEQKQTAKDRRDSDLKSLGKEEPKDEAVLRARRLTIETLGGVPIDQTPASMEGSRMVSVESGLEELDPHDEAGDVVVEGDEDTVLY